MLLRRGQQVCIRYLHNRPVIRSFCANLEQVESDDDGPNEYVSRRLKVTKAKRFNVWTVFGRRHDVQTHIIRALLDYFKTPYVYHECDPLRKQELLVNPNYSPDMSFPLIQICSSESLVLNERKFRKALIDVMPEQLKDSVRKAPARLMIDIATAGASRHHKTKKDQIDNLQLIYTTCTQEAATVETVWFQGEFVIPDVLNLLEAQKKFQTKQFMPRAALEKAEWIEDSLVPLIDQCTITSFSQAFQRYMYIMRYRKMNILRREWIHTFLSMRSRLVVRRQLRQKTGVGSMPRQELYEHFENFLDDLESNQFSGVLEPNLIDLMVYGCLNAVEDLDTGYHCLDKVEGLDDWYKRMMDEVGHTQCVEEFMYVTKWQKPVLQSMNFMTNLGRISQENTMAQVTKTGSSKTGKTAPQMKNFHARTGPKKTEL